MNEEIIRKYAKLMKELDLTGLEISENDTVVKLERAAAAAAPMPVSYVSSASADNAEKNNNAGGYDTITSPMVGIFYAAPAENAEPFVKEGSHVKKGDTVCIIEAMKLMNEVTAERDGVIKKICVSNGNAVEYGTVLFQIGD